MVNAKTRNQWKALESTEALTSSAREEKGEAQVPPAQAPSVAVSKREKSWSRKRKLDAVLEQEGAAPGVVAIPKDIEDCIRGKRSIHKGSSDVEVNADRGVGTMGSSDPRAPAQQRASRRVLHGAMEKPREIEVDALADTDVSPDMTGNEAVFYDEVKEGKRKVLGHKARKQSKERVGDVSFHGKNPNPNRKRRNLLHGLEPVNEEFVNLARPLTRGMVKPSADGQTGPAFIKKRKRLGPEEKVEAATVAERESTETEAPVQPAEEAAERPGMELPNDGCNVESSNKTAEFDLDSNTDALLPVESPAAVSGLNHVPLQAEAQLSSPGRAKKHGASMPEVHLVKRNRDRPPRPISTRVTRRTKNTVPDLAGIVKGSPTSEGEGKSRSSNDEPLDQVPESSTVVEAASMKLRNHKKVGNLNSSERPPKLVKKKQDKPNDSMSKSRTAISIEGLGIIDAATFDSQGNDTAPDGDESTSQNNGGGAHLSLPDGALTKGSKMDGQAGIERHVDSGLLPPVSGLAVECVEGGVNKINVKDSSDTKKCTEGDGREGGRLGRMKKREKKKLDPGGCNSLQEKGARDPPGSVQEHGKILDCEMIKECSQVGSGPSNESQSGPDIQGIDVQNLEGMTSVVAGKSLQPVELAEFRAETGVQKSVHLAEADGGCEDNDHHQPAPITLRENNLDTLAPREGPPKAGVLTRASEGNGRKPTPANGSIKKKLKTKGTVGRWKTGRKAADSRVLLQNPENHADNSGVDSAHEMAVEERKNSVQDEQIHLDAQVEESTQLGCGPLSEVETGLGEERGDAVGTDFDSLEVAGMPKDPSELQDVRFGDKIGVGKSVELTETDGGGKQDDQHELSNEGNDGVKHLEKVVPRKLPVRTTGVLTRRRKVEFESSTEPALESGLIPRLSGHSDQRGKHARKKKIGVGKDIGAEVESVALVDAKAHVEKSNDRGTIVVDNGGLSTNSECQAEKRGVEAILDKKNGEGEAVEASRTVENRIELQDKVSEEEKGTELPAQFAEVDGGYKDNDHNQALETQSVETHDLRVGKKFLEVNCEHNPSRRIRKKGSLRVGERYVPARSLLLSCMGLINLDLETVSTDAGTTVLMTSKSERKKQASGGDCDGERREIGNLESVASVRVTVQGLEPASKASADGKDRRGTEKEVQEAVAAGSQPSVEKTDSVLPTQDGSVTEESYQGGLCDGDDKGQVELSKGSPVPKLPKPGRSHIVTALSNVIEGKVDPEVGQCVKVTQLSPCRGVDSDVVRLNQMDPVRQRSVLDGVVKVTPEALQIGLQTGDGNVPDQGEHCSCYREGERKLLKDLSSPKDCSSCRSKTARFTSVILDDSTFKETSDPTDLVDGHKAFADIIQSKHDEGRAEPLNVAVKVTQNPLQVNAEPALQSLEAESRPGSVQVPMKKLWRRKNYGCGIEFQRITRARDSTRKSVPNIESQGSKNGELADAVSGEHVETRAEVVVSKIDTSKDSSCLEEADAEKECVGKGKSLLDVSDLLEKSASALPTHDNGGATIEQGKEVNGMEGQKSQVLASAGTGYFAVLEAVNTEDPTSIPSSILKHMEESETAVLGEVNGEPQDQPPSSTVSLPYFQQRNFMLCSKLPDSPDGPFALEDGKSLTLHCGQVKASNLDDGGLNLEVSHSRCLETNCSQDVHHFGALGANSVSMLDKSEPLAAVETPNSLASIDSSAPVASLVGSDRVITMVESSPVARVDQSGPVATVVKSDPVSTVVESSLVASSVESGRVGDMVESSLVASVDKAGPVATIVEPGCVGTMVDSFPFATPVESDPFPTSVEMDPTAVVAGSDYVGTMALSFPVDTSVESDPVPTSVDFGPVAAVVASNPVAAVVESDPVAAVVELDPAVTLVSDPVSAVVESDPVASVVESEPVASTVESDLVASSIVSHPVPFTAESDLLKTMVDLDPGATAVQSDPFTAAEGVDPITTSDSSNSVDMQNSISTENMFDAFPAFCKPDGAAAVADSDSVTGLVTTASNAVVIATVESVGVHTDVVTKENTTSHLLVNCKACEFSPGREFAGGSERTIGEYLTDAMNSQQEQVTFEALSEDSEFNEEVSTKFHLREREGCQLTLSGEVGDSIHQGQPTPVEDLVRQLASELEDSFAEVCVSSERKTEEKESVTETEPGMSLQGGACVKLVSTGRSQLGFTDQTCSKLSSDVVELERVAAYRTRQEGSRLPLSEHCLLEEMAERGVDLSCKQKSLCCDALELPVGTGQVVTSLAVEPIEMDRKEDSITSPTSRSSLDDVPGDDETLQKVPSGVKVLQQTKSEEQEPDELILKNVDHEIEDRTELHDETEEKISEDCEVHVKAYGTCTESPEVHSISVEMVTNDGVQSEAKQVNLNAEGVNLAAGTVQAEVHDVQTEAQLVGGVEGLDHLSFDGESVNVDTEVKQIELDVKEIRVGANDLCSELDWRTAASEEDSQQEVDAEASDAVADEVANKNEHHAERVLALDHLDTLSSGQPLLPSIDLGPGCVGGLLPVTDLAISVPELDSRRPVTSNSTLDQQTGPTNEPSRLDTEKDVQVEDVCMQSSIQETVHLVQPTSPLRASRHLDGDVPEELPDIQLEIHERGHSKPTFRLEDPVQSNQLDTVQVTFPLEASRCLEGDVLHSEEVSDIQMETHEKGDSKNQASRSEEPVSQRNMAGVKGSLVSKKRKGRTGIETPREPECVARAEDAPCRVYSKRKGFLLTSTTIESGGMRIRPRPLDPDQSIPILVEGRDKDFHDYDGGSFYRWVQQQEEAKLKKPTPRPVADGVSGSGGLSCVSRTDLFKKRRIFIPLFRKLPDVMRTSAKIVTRPEQDVMTGMESAFPRPHGYLQYTKPAARNLGHALGGSFCTVPSVYDMDDEDEEWLQAYNEILKHSGPDQLLSEDTFEQLIELFEREFYRVCQITDKSIPVLPRILGEKCGASGRRGKRLVMDSSQRHCRLEASPDGALVFKSMEILQGALSQKETERKFAVQNRSDDCCICNGGENSDSNPVRRCQICSINVHESCYGICATMGNEFGHHAGRPNWRCKKCEAVVGGTALHSISCAICCKSGGAMKPTVDPLKWAHVACALYTNETFFIDTEAMEPVDGLAAVETRVKRQRERCGLCGAREGSCVRCSTRGCRTPFHISCGVSQGASFELRHTKQQVEGIRSFCPLHATLVPGTNMDEILHAPSKIDDAGEPLPAVSTESSDCLEIRHIERGSMGDEGNGAEDAIINGAGCQGSFTNKIKLHRPECKRYFRKFRRRAGAGGPTPSIIDPNSSPHEVSQKDVHGVSRTLPRSGSMLKDNMQGVSQYMDETDPYLHPSDAEKLESEAVSAATSASSSHLTNFENVDHAGNATSNVDAVDPVILAAKVKSVTRDAYMSDAVFLKFPSLDALDTNLAPSPIVKAVYSFWQVKRVKAKGPILHELRQLQVARSRGIFNKVVLRSTDFLPSVVHDSPARIPITRRPRSLNRDPVFSKFSDVRQQLEILRSIASNVVRREQMKLEDQKLVYESLQQQLLIAREAPRRRRCLWCQSTQSLLNCTSCPKAFCFLCFKHRRGYGVKGWIAASKLPKYVCNSCLGSIAQERGWPELSTNFSEPRGIAASRLALAPGRVGDWSHNLEVRTKSNPGKQVSFLNETCNPYGSRSSPLETASTMAPGRGKMIYTGRPIDAHASHSKFAVPFANDRSVALDVAYHGGVASSSPNDPAGNDSREQLDHPNVEGKKVKRRKAKVVNKQVEPTGVLRATKRIKKLARSSSFVYGSEDETTVSENGESPTDKRTVKLSDLRDKDGESQCTNLLEVGAGDKAEKGHPSLKFGIKFSPTGKLIVRRHGPPQLP